MNQYVTGATIKSLREKRALTQSELASQLNVSDKAISRWETGKGYPDITLLEPLARALQVSVTELISGAPRCNTNASANMLRSKFHVCPVCGNVILATGEASIICHGVELPPLEAEPLESKTPGQEATAESSTGPTTKSTTKEHLITLQQIDGEYYVHTDHPMTKSHYVSFIAAVSPNGVQLVKTYPESTAQARFMISGVSDIYLFCNKDGLFRTHIPMTKRTDQNR